MDTFKKTIEENPSKEIEVTVKKTGKKFLLRLNEINHQQKCFEHTKIVGEMMVSLI